jgi:hypothetical protein
MGSHGLDNTGRFVAHNDGRNPAARLAGVALNIRATDATSLDAHENVVVANLRDRQVTVFQRIRFRMNERFHSDPLP